MQLLGKLIRPFFEGIWRYQWRAGFLKLYLRNKNYLWHSILSYTKFETTLSSIIKIKTFQTVHMYMVGLTVDNHWSRIVPHKWPLTVVNFESTNFDYCIDAKGRKNIWSYNRKSNDGASYVSFSGATYWKKLECSSSKLISVFENRWSWK